MVLDSQNSFHSFFFPFQFFCGDGTLSDTSQGNMNVALLRIITLSYKLVLDGNGVICTGTNEDEGHVLSTTKRLPK